MNILVGIGGYPPDFTGAGFRIHRMYRSLKKSENINRVIVLTKIDVKKKEKRKIFRDGIEIVYVPGCFPNKNSDRNNFISSFLNVLAIVRHATLTVKCFFGLWKEIDIVHTIGSGWFENIIAYCAIIAQKPIAKEIVLLGTDDPIAISKKNYFIKLLFLAPFKFSNIIITNSKPLQNACKQSGIPDYKIWCRPNPIYIEVAFNYNLSRELQLLFKMPTILYVGILEKRKNIEFLIESAQYLSRKTQLIFIGPYSDELYQKSILFLSEKITKKSNGLASFQFLGRIDDRNKLAEIYRQSSLFWFASLKEGLPNVVLESLICGTPVVTLPVDGIMKDIFTNNNPELGEIVETDCPLVFASVVNKWLEKKYDKKLISGKIKEICDNKKIELGYIEHFQHILNR